MTFIKRISLSLLVAFAFAYGHAGGENLDEEEYSISLVKTAEPESETRRLSVGDVEVLAESHQVKKGEHIFEILRERGLMGKNRLMELLTALKELNPALSNLDLIYPGQEILIPIEIISLGSFSGPGAAHETNLSSSEPFDFENYTVRPGDSLIKVIRSRYDIPQDELYEEYFSLVRKLNPFIKELSMIHPGQVIRLPVYTAEKIRMPIRPPQAGLEEEMGHEDLKKALRWIFTELGEEWIETGEHYIPLPSGGQVELQAGSYPMISLQSGLHVILDIACGLQANMARLLQNSGYRVVQPEKAGLRETFDELISVCGYEKVYKRDEPLIIDGDIRLECTADWIVQTSEQSPEDSGFAMIALAGQGGPRMDAGIRNYLESRGLKVIEYPPDEEETGGDETGVCAALKPGGKWALVEEILRLTGREFLKQTEVSVYQSSNKDINVVVNADFILSGYGPEKVIDLSGLGQDMIALLVENRFSVLSLADQKDPVRIVRNTLEFLEIPFNFGPCSLRGADEKAAGSVKVTVDGLVFKGISGERFLATSARLPGQIVDAFAREGTRILDMSLSASATAPGI